MKFKLNITHKLFIYLFFACLLPILLFGIVAVYKTKTVYRHDIDQYSKELIENKAEYIDLLMQSVESLIQNLSSVEEIRTALMDESGKDYDRLASQARIGYILSGYYNLNGLVSIDIFSVKGSHYHVGDTLNYYDIRSDLMKGIFDKAAKAQNEIIWNGIEDNVNKNSSYGKVITASKAISILNDVTLEEKSIGLIIVNYDIEAFTKNIISNPTNASEYAIIDGDKRIVYNDDNKMIGEYINPDIAGKIDDFSGSFTERIDGDSKLIYYVHSKKSNWTILSIIPEKYIKAKNFDMDIIIMVLVIFCFLMISLFTFLISRNYLTPIKHITEMFKQLKKGRIDLNTRLGVKSNDEIGDLAVWFNAFLENLEEKKIADETLFKSREQYRSVVDNIRDVVFQTDEKGNWTFLNPSWYEITGYTMEESIGANFLEFVHPDERVLAYKAIMPIIKKKNDYFRQKTRFFTKNGEMRWAEVLGKATYDEAGCFTGVSGTMEDVTERINMEREILQSESLLRGVTNAANILLGITEYNLDFVNVLKTLGELINVDRVLIIEKIVGQLKGHVGENLRFEWCRPEYLSKHLETQMDIAGSVNGLLHGKLASGNIYSALTAELSEHEQTALYRLGILSVLAVPIIAEGAFNGYIIFGDCTREREWSKVEKDTMKVAAVSVGGAFQRIQAEQSIRNMLKDDFRKTVQNLQNLIFKAKLDKERTPVFTLFEGRKAYELGLDTNAVLGKKPEDFLPAELAGQLNTAFLRAFTGEPVMFEFSELGWRAYSILSPVFEGSMVTEVVGSVFDITDLKNAEEKIKYLAYYDSLTGLPNRALCVERLGEAISEARYNGSIVAILFLDLDQFKFINDSLGHAIGDNLLKEAATRLINCTRESDTVSRMGGDEFVLFYPGIHNIDAVDAIAGKILSEFRKPFMIKEHELFITTSIGVSVYPDDGKSLEELFKCADMAMYKAKEQGRDNYQFFTNEMRRQATERLKMENDLRKAIEQNEFFLEYQPKVDTYTGKVIGLEALLRWQHPVFGLISPGSFIPLAEDSGLILQIGEWVITEACKQNKMLQDMGYDNMCISVNISPKQFQQQNIVEVVKMALASAGLEPGFLELEITENCIISNTEKTIVLMHELKQLGVKISIDDFGKGFSSMTYLKRFKVDKLKIDKSFVADIENSQSDSTISLAIISMAHSLNLMVVAEGVETKEQLDILRLYNCDEIQGYYFSKPLQIEALINFLANCYTL